LVDANVWQTGVERLDVKSEKRSQNGQANAIAQVLPERCLMESKALEVLDMKFSKDAEFFDVEGIPVSIGAGDSGPYCAAWDVSPPRPFDPDSARRNGAPVSEDQFKRLIVSEKTAS
jgi:hypothetical protein